MLARLGLSLLLLIVVWYPSRVLAAPCQDQALGELKRLHPLGFSVYVEMRRKGDFLRWITCDDVQLGLTTAIHESVHHITAEEGAYPLIGGGRLPTIAADPNLFPPSNLASRFDRQSPFVSTYLQRGNATSNEEFGFLLDELNAYSHDLHAAVGLQRLAGHDRIVYHRDGLAALMSFVASYVNEAYRGQPQSWRIIMQPGARRTIQVLWTQAETVMAGSCRVPDFADEAPGFLGGVCSATFKDGIGQLLGRPPACPLRCAKPQLFGAAR